MERIATQTTIKYLNKSSCESILISLPTIEEQQLLCNKISGVSKVIYCFEMNAEKLKSQKLGLMQDLLTGKVPVKVDIPVADSVNA